MKKTPSIDALTKPFSSEKSEDTFWCTIKNAHQTFIGVRKPKCEAIAIFLVDNAKEIYQQEVYRLQLGNHLT